jgi:uncharacterized iron-regulated protein
MGCRFFTGIVVIAGLAAGVLSAGYANAELAVQQVDILSEKTHHYVLNRPFDDYYDTAFVLTDAGKNKPRVINLDELADTLVKYDVVFFGEIHRHPGVHLQQLRLFRALHARNPNLALSLEQFERDTQGVMDDYLAGRIGEDALVDKGRAWDNYAPSYRPLVTYAKENHLPVIAAEAPDWSISCIGQWGPVILDEFTPQERAWVTRDLHLNEGAYRNKYMKFQESSATHGGGGNTPEARQKAERSFAAQATRDDTMAESIYLALQKNPGRKVLHLNGDFHSAGFLGTVERLKLRDQNLKIAVIVPVEAENRLAPAFDKSGVNEATVLQLIYPNPPSFAGNEDMSEWIKSVMTKRKANSCKYTPKGMVQPPALAVKP